MRAAFEMVLFSVFVAMLVDDIRTLAIDTKQQNRCAYLATDPDAVTWGWTSTEAWMITMIVSWCIVAAFLCALGFGWFFNKGREGYE